VRSLFVVLLLVLPALPAIAKVHVVPVGKTCTLGSDLISGLNDNQCKLLTALADGKVVRGCVVRGQYIAELNEDQCDLIDGNWTWVLQR
jgi:hypothetical protein